jgi:hypothetical protein
MSAPGGDRAALPVQPGGPRAARLDRLHEEALPVEDLQALIRRAWSDVMNARDHCDEAREQRAERRMNALLGRLSAQLASVEADAAPPRT